MLKFISVERDMPEKRQAQARRQDFDEIYAEYADAYDDATAERNGG